MSIPAVCRGQTGWRLKQSQHTSSPCPALSFPHPLQTGSARSPSSSNLASGFQPANRSPGLLPVCRIKTGPPPPFSAPGLTATATLAGPAGLAPSASPTSPRIASKCSRIKRAFFTPKDKVGNSPPSSHNSRVACPLKLLRLALLTVHLPSRPSPGQEQNPAPVPSQCWPSSSGSCRKSRSAQIHRKLAHCADHTAANDTFCYLCSCLTMTFQCSLSPVIGQCVDYQFNSPEFNSQAFSLALPRLSVHFAPHECSNRAPPNCTPSLPQTSQSLRSSC